MTRRRSGRWPSRTSETPATCSAPVWDGGSGRDGYVSLEVDPRLAYDTLATFREAMRLHESVDRPNLMVKIPATKPGLAAIEDVIAKGRSINVTLIFSLRRYAEVAESYIRGIERLVAEGGDPTQGRARWRASSSRASTPRPTGAWMRSAATTSCKGKLAIANAKLAYAHYQEAFAGPRWEFLAGKGATPQRVLWASTSTKNPAYPDTLYVEELIGADTVNTMPEETIMAYQDHGEPEPRLEQGAARTRTACFERARARGRRLRRRHRHARARGGREILGLLRRAARRRCAPSRRTLAPA